jgi:predicted nucleotidyltransferase component of viral defense system
VTKGPKKDVGASVRARLLRLARERGEDFQLLLTRYANERLLYRLAQSSYGARFALKGAALFTLWTGKPHRATRDLDPSWVSVSRVSPSCGGYSRRCSRSTSATMASHSMRVRRTLD